MSGLQAYVPLMPLVGIIRSWYTDRYQEIIDTNPIRETYKGFRLLG